MPWAVTCVKNPAVTGRLVVASCGGRSAVGSSSERTTFPTFDIKIDKNGQLKLVSKDGKVVIPTGYFR